MTDKYTIENSKGIERDFELRTFAFDYVLELMNQAYKEGVKDKEIFFFKTWRNDNEELVLMIKDLKQQLETASNNANHYANKCIELEKEIKRQQKLEGKLRSEIDRYENLWGVAEMKRRELEKANEEIIGKLEKNNIGISYKAYKELDIQYLESLSQIQHLKATLNAVMKSQKEELEQQTDKVSGIGCAPSFLGVDFAENTCEALLQKANEENAKLKRQLEIAAHLRNILCRSREKYNAEKDKNFIARLTVIRNERGNYEMTLESGDTPLNVNPYHIFTGLGLKQ